MASASPSVSPSVSPSASPSVSPSTSTSSSPSMSISASPSRSPSMSISASPSVSPSVSPSASPSTSVSASPSESLPILSEQSILNIVYALYEGDTSNWSTTSDEYLSARVYANAAINRWEYYENTNWQELWTTLDDSSSLNTKTLTAGTSTYACPRNMIKPASYVRTEDSAGTSTFWEVLPIARVPSFASNTTYHYCYFTGSIMSGFTLHFNPNITLTTGNTIKYEYYKKATLLTTTTSTTEMADPYFIVYFVLSRLYENDGEDGKSDKAFQEAEARLENMRVNNMLHLEGVRDNIEWTLDNLDGFGS